MVALRWGTKAGQREGRNDGGVGTHCRVSGKPRERMRGSSGAREGNKRTGLGEVGGGWRGDRWDPWPGGLDEFRASSRVMGRHCGVAGLDFYLLGGEPSSWGVGKNRREATV